MDWKESLAEKLTTYSDAEFDYIETNNISEASKIDLGCTGIYMEATIIYFEIKNFPISSRKTADARPLKPTPCSRRCLPPSPSKHDAFVNCFSPNAFLVVSIPARKNRWKRAVKGALRLPMPSVKLQATVLLHQWIGVCHGSRPRSHHGHKEHV